MNLYLQLPEGKWRRKSGEKTVDIKALINSILSAPKLAEKDKFASKIYHDEPILQTAAQMAGYLPAKYRHMRKIAKDGGLYYESDEILFYKQGKFMEDFEDDFDYHGEFVRYFPTYQSMNDMQLRGYFSWRTKVRRGEIAQTSISFAFVYIYELLNQIGVGSAEQGFHALKNFWLAYRQLDSRIDRYMKRWLSDYVVYYDLDHALLADFPETVFDRAVLILLDYEAHNCTEVFSALHSLSSYNLANSRFYKQFPAEVEQVVYSVFASLSVYYGKNRKSSLCEKFFGKPYENRYYMFSSAVFYDRIKRRNFLYEVNGVYKFRCKNSVWTCERFFCCREKSKEIGGMLKTVDYLMRQAYGFKSTLKEGRTTKFVIDIIQKEIEKHLEEKKKNETDRVEIDISLFKKIRETSLITQSKLIVEEESEEAEQEEIVGTTGMQMDTLLSETEIRFIHCLLSGLPFEEILKQETVKLSVIVDSVNEKLFDTFLDTVIIFDGDSPQVIEEYSDELKGIIGQ